MKKQQPKIESDPIRKHGSHRPICLSERNRRDGFSYIRPWLGVGRKNKILIVFDFLSSGANYAFAN